ncbi:MAG: hypothetical protein JWR15_2672, partial [Prosthecobacter sp.]|nr:hypothetical protein [Prosthecobacter sp.]
LPAGLTRPQFFRATGDGSLKLAYQQLTSTEGNAALITLADLTTVLRPDGTRWDIAQYSLINRSLQFLPVILPDHAELISVSVSGEPVRADEETQNGTRVRLIPLIHTRPGQRALEVKMIYRFAQDGALKRTTKLDDPEVVGLSVERTTWTVWTPQGWNLKDFDGNMTATAAEGRELLQLEGMLSELGETNRALSSGKLDYGEAASAYNAANALAQMVQQKKRAILTKVGRGSLMISDSKMDTEVRQQQDLLKGNWDNNYASKKAVTKGGKEEPVAKEKTSWGMNDAAPQEQQVRLSANNTFSGSVTTNGGQLFNDNLAVDNSYFSKGVQVPQKAQSVAIDSLLKAAPSGKPQTLTQNATGSVNTVNSNARSNNLGNNSGSQTKPVEAKPAAGVPAMGVDPFAAPAAAPDLPEAKDAKRKGDSDGDEMERLPVLAQTVESLRPTGRRALGIDLPLDGTAHHFSKLKDHAVLEVAIKRVGDPKTTSRLVCLAGGLLLWVGIGWKLKRRSRQTLGGNSEVR